jgi:hypothetical protein
MHLRNKLQADWQAVLCEAGWNRSCRLTRQIEWIGVISPVDDISAIAAWREIQSDLKT